MNNDDKIKILIFGVGTDSEFGWTLKSFPKEYDNLCENNCVLVYLKNPTKEDIVKTVQKIATEFNEGFYPIENEYLKVAKDEIHNALLKSVGEDIAPTSFFSSHYFGRGFCNAYWNNGIYNMTIKLIDYVKKEVKYVNTNEKDILGMFDLESIDLI